jgi:hypothetical protein
MLQGSHGLCACCSRTAVLRHTVCIMALPLAVHFEHLTLRPVTQFAPGSPATASAASAADYSSRRSGGQEENRRRRDNAHQLPLSARRAERDMRDDGGARLRHRSNRGVAYMNKSRRKGRPAWQRSPDDSPLRDGNRDRLIGLLTLRAAKTLEYYFFETNLTYHNWLSVRRAALHAACPLLLFSAECCLEHPASASSGSLCSAPAATCTSMCRRTPRETTCTPSFTRPPLRRNTCATTRSRPPAAGTTSPARRSCASCSRGVSTRPGTGGGCPTRCSRASAASASTPARSRSASWTSAPRSRPSSSRRAACAGLAQLCLLPLDRVGCVVVQQCRPFAGACALSMRHDARSTTRVPGAANAWAR